MHHDGSQSCPNMVGWGIISETHTEPWSYLDGRHLSVTSPAEVRELLEVVAKPHRSAFRCSSLFNLKLQMVEVREIMVPPRSANTELMLIQRLMLQQSTFLLKTVNQESPRQKLKTSEKKQTKCAGNNKEVSFPRFPRILRKIILKIPKTV